MTFEAKVNEIATNKCLRGNIKVYIDNELWKHCGVGTFFGIGYNWLCNPNEVDKYFYDAKTETHEFYLIGYEEAK